MRRDGIPYVKNPSVLYPPVDYKKMDLKELTEKYIKACAKANGAVSTCSLCATPCEYGKRAVQLVANQIYNDPPIPLYGGKTLIERAKEENKLRKEKEAIDKKQEDKPKKRAPYLRGDEWWAESLKYGDQVEYLEKEYGYSKTKAKATIYRYRSRHGLAGSPNTPAELEAKNTPEKKDEEVIIQTAEPVKEENKPAVKGDVVVSTMELKLNELIKLQDEYKSKAEEYMKLYNQAKEQVDTLCKAMELFQ